MLLHPGGQSLLVHLPAARGAPLELAPVPQPELCPPPPAPQPGVALDSPGLHAGGGVKDATPPGAGRGLGRHAHRWLGRVVVCVGGPPSLPLVLGRGASAPHRGNPFPPNTHYWTAPPWTAPRQRGGCTGAPGRVLVGLWGALCTRISERVRDACAVRVCGEQVLGGVHLCPLQPAHRATCPHCHGLAPALPVPATPKLPASRHPSRAHVCPLHCTHSSRGPF